MTDAGAFLLAASVLVGMVTLGLILARSLNGLARDVRGLRADYAEAALALRESQQRIERRLGLLHGSTPVDPLERHPRHPPEPPAYG